MSYAIRPDVVGRSPLAIVSSLPQRDVRDRLIPVWGVAMHCTGSGIVSQALAKGRDPFEYVLEHYGSLAVPYFAHYVIDFDGKIAAVADEHEDAQHVGFAPDQRASFLDGSWTSKLPSSYVASWRERWPSYKSPAHLFPGASPNQAYIGFEMLCWQAGCAGSPRAPGMLYTEAQHAAAAALSADIASRWGFATGHWYSTGRMACHEDLNPLDRTANGQGWDPGIIRSSPYFDWPDFIARLVSISSGAAA